MKLDEEKCVILGYDVMKMRIPVKIVWRGYGDWFETHRNMC